MSRAIILTVSRVWRSPDLARMAGVPRSPGHAVLPRQGCLPVVHVGDSSRGVVSCSTRERSVVLYLVPRGCTPAGHAYLMAL